MSATVDESEPASPDEPTVRGGMRQMFDALICLSVAVILVRMFQVEGYMISTGSMAPTLPGFHKRVTCPSCGIEFAVGDAHASDESDSPSTPVATSLLKHAVCPNCGKGSIDLSKIPRNQGDQLLVHKNAYSYVDPHRWEVVVFRNPSRPTQAYVKRLVGFPGETIQIINGDLWINKEIERKSFARQRAMRILVYDHDYEPENDPDWQPRWNDDSASSDWKRTGHNFAMNDRDIQPATGGQRQLSWVTYRHWIRTGGQHRTRIAVPKSLQKHNLTTPSLYPLKYDSQTATFSHTGVLTARDRDRISAVIDDPEYRQLIQQFHKRAHLAPITDEYGYNRIHRGYHPVPVRDLTLAASVDIKGGHGQFAMELTDGLQKFRFILDAGTRDVFLMVDDQQSPFRKARLKADVLVAPLKLEMSLVDRQVLIAINGQTLFSPVNLEPIPAKTPYSRTPVKFGAKGLDVRVEALKIYRDVHYTEKGSKEPYTLNSDEFYMLGDNSPVSADSRVWEGGGVHRQLLLGKPILVHLPSRPGIFQIGGINVHIRIPDLSRIRYIR